jgi:hypothetical protein
MNRTFIGAAVVAALAMKGYSAHASCADPRTAAQQGGYQPMSPLLRQNQAGDSSWKDGRRGRSIVGTWHATCGTATAPSREYQSSGPGR